VTQAIGRGPQFPLLVLGRLVGGTDPQIQRRAHGEFSGLTLLYIGSFSTPLILLMLQCGKTIDLLGQKKYQSAG
jgi:hypothetical protein